MLTPEEIQKIVLVIAMYIVYALLITELLEYGWERAVDDTYRELARTAAADELDKGPEELQISYKKAETCLTIIWIAGALFCSSKLRLKGKELTSMSQMEGMCQYLIVDAYYDGKLIVSESSDMKRLPMKKRINLGERSHEALEELSQFSIMSLLDLYGDTDTVKDMIIEILDFMEGKDLEELLEPDEIGPLLLKINEASLILDKEGEKNND